MHVVETDAAYDECRDELHPRKYLFFASIVVLSLSKKKIVKHLYHYGKLFYFTRCVKLCIFANLFYSNMKLYYNCTTVYLPIYFIVEKNRRDRWNKNCEINEEIIADHRER